ncbi:hypothetical protein [Sphaerisporangium sp. NPDC051011]|uniref:hypothetical protein n=1 Tax=Sphaerisporangium sp. NPDC051011 TaxID=3155792 RepID=UPI0033DB28DB
MNRRRLLVVAGWLVVALIATGAGVVVTAFLGEAVTGSSGRVLTVADVRRELAAAPSASGVGGGSADGAPSPAGPSRTPGDTESPEDEPSPRDTPPARTASPRPSGHSDGVGEVISARGGVVVARCEGGLVTLLTWTPAPGYQVKEAEPGPRDKVRVRFESERARTEIEIYCIGDRPIPAAEVKED